MSGNPFGHVDLRVTDMRVGRRFYARLLPELGFEIDDSGKSWQVFSVKGEPPSAPWFGFVEAPDHRPNDNRIAFWAAGRDEVDRLAAVAREAGARNISGPRDCPEYSSTYYAVFFEDPFGNCLEVCYRED